MKYLRGFLWGIILIGFCFVICKSQNEDKITNVEQTRTLSNQKTGRYVSIYNADIIFTVEGKIYVKPNTGFSWEKTGLYKKDKNDKDFSGLYAGFTVSNVKKAVIYIDGNDVNFLYYEESEDSRTIHTDGYMLLQQHDPECSDADDCQKLYGNPPLGMKWVCKDGVCVFG